MAASRSAQSPGDEVKRLATFVLAALLVACGKGEHHKGDAAESPPQALHEAKQEKISEHAVIVHFEYGNRDWAPFFEFERTLEAAISSSDAGEYDGNELAVDGSDGTLYMYGPNADKLFEVVKPRLESFKLLKNVEVTLRYGPTNNLLARETKIRLGT